MGGNSPEGDGLQRDNRVLINAGLRFDCCFGDVSHGSCDGGWHVSEYGGDSGGHEDWHNGSYGVWQGSSSFDVGRKHGGGERQGVNGRQVSG